MKLTAAFTLPGERSGNDAANGSCAGATSSLPPVANGDGRGMGGMTIRLGVTVKTRWAARSAEPAEVVERGERREMWARWLAQGRYRSRREPARAVGVCPSVVTRVLKGER